jgi:hypothetical protein
MVDGAFGGSIGTMLGMAAASLLGLGPVGFGLFAILGAIAGVAYALKKKDK